jgi:D-alanyl-lipoteichoic acid acyltransferase DltB (MBOAT superfamily)
LLNFGILFLFKYLGWLTGLINPVLGLFNHGWVSVNWAILMPLGISFYTFQSIGYLIDVYNARVQAETNLFKFALFTSFFPQLIQGPISRFDQLHPQLISGHSPNAKNIGGGLLLISWGVFKVLCISIPAAIIYAGLIGGSGLDIFVAVVAWGLNLYTAFSGGIDIARGCSLVLGINMAENFRRPYFATGVGDFWRRWHITLGSWFKDYVFYPISLSKPYGRVTKAFRRKFPNNFGKIMPTCLVMFFVFVLIGIWHGAEAKFVVYGLYMGLFVALGVFTQEPLKKWGRAHPHLTKRNIVLRALAIIGTFVIITFGRYIISAPNLGSAFTRFINTFKFGETKLAFDQTGLTAFNYEALGGWLLILFLVSLIGECGLSVRELLFRAGPFVQTICVGVVALSIIFLAVYPGADYNDPNYQSENYERNKIPEVVFPYENS